MNFKKLTNSQWSFFYAGIAYGIAQIVYMIGVMISDISKGKEAAIKPLTVTTDLGKMFRGVEVFVNNLFGFQSELYGTYGTTIVDGVEKTMASSGGAFVPGIGWPIVGMMIGGLLVSIMEKESRSWAKYSKKALFIAFVGGMFFSYGTRLAGGCTLNHLMGGVPMMNIHSLVTIIFMAIGGTLGFFFMDKLNLAKYFKHQETLSYVKNADKGEQATYDPGYKPLKSKAYIIGLAFTLLFVIVAFAGGLFNPEGLQHLDKAGNIKAFGKSIADAGGFYVILTLAAGILGGIGLAKSGFGTECALVSAETAKIMSKNDSKFAGMGVPKITRTLMRSFYPIIGIATHWVVMMVFVLFAWIILGAQPGFEGSTKYSLTAGSVLGGLFLGFGAVTLIGCEIRSYMRIGMGYQNTLVGFVGFAFGYLPFTLFYEEHTNFLHNTTLIGKDGAWSEAYKVYQLFGENPVMQKSIMVAWWALLLFILIFLVKKGMKYTGLTKVYMLHKNTEEAQLYLDKEAEAHNGMVNGVPAPAPVPSKAL